MGKDFPSKFPLPSYLYSVHVVTVDEIRRHTEKRQRERSLAQLTICSFLYLGCLLFFSFQTFPPSSNSITSFVSQLLRGKQIILFYFTFFKQIKSKGPPPPPSLHKKLTRQNGGETRQKTLVNTVAKEYVVNLRKVTYTQVAYIAYNMPVQQSRRVGGGQKKKKKRKKSV